MKTNPFISFLLASFLIACSNDADNPSVTPTENEDAGVGDLDAGVESDMSSSEDQGHQEDAAPDDGEDQGPEESAAIELSPELCDDPSNLQKVLAASEEGSMTEGGSGLEMNVDELPALLANPTERFYMVNLIKYREVAEYPDGRETNLTGREANSLYNPLPFISAIGGRVVYSATVDQQLAGGDDVIWDDVALVEYPCAIALLAMSTHPDFKETSVHKGAGIETTRVMFTKLQSHPSPADPAQSDATFPPTDEDPAFDLIQVMKLHDTARYEPDANEPERTGEEALDLYETAETEASVALGHYPIATFEVMGTLIGEDTGWHEIQFVRMSSEAGFQALLEDPEVQASSYHRQAAIEDVDTMAASPKISSIPYTDGEGSMTTPEVTPNGTGTLCQEDSDCPGAGFICLSNGSDGGFCTPEGCEANTCEGSYLCCHSCNPMVASNLPFDGSACLPSTASSKLSEAPVSCTCD